MSFLSSTSTIGPTGPTGAIGPTGIRCIDGPTGPGITGAAGTGITGPTGPGQASNFSEDISMNNRLKVVGKTDLLGDLDARSRLFVQKNVYFYRDIITSASIQATNLTATGFINGNYQDNSIPRNAISSY